MTSTIKFPTCLLTSLLLVLLLFSGGALQAGEAIIDTPRFGVLPLALYSDYLEDASGQLRLETLPTDAQAWTPATADHLNARFTNATTWLRARVSNQSGHALTMLLDTGTAVADFVDIHVLRADGGLQSVYSGDRRPFHSRPFDSRTVTLPLQLSAGESVTVFLRQTSWDGLHETLIPRLWTPEAYADQLQLEALIFGTLYGSIGALLLYNLFLLASTRQRGFHLYLLFVAAFLAWSFIFRGYAFQYLWPNSPTLNNQLLPLLASVCYCAFGLFALEYLQIRRMAPTWLHRASWLAIGCNALILIPPLFGLYAPTFAASLVSGVVMHVAIVTTSLVLIRRGSRPARYFLLAFTALACGIVIYYLHLLGWLSANPLTQFGIQVGASLEVLLLAFGLADQVNTLKAQKLQAEQAARSAQLALTTKLSKEVELRTRELEQANRRLNELSITDELTGCYNRRHFNRLFAEEFANHRRQNTPLTFCMIDIDNFKAYNDHYGHQAGDEVLRRISHCLQDKLRRLNDQLFRLGGEEFAVLLHLDQPATKAQPFVEEMRQAIEALALSHAASPLGVVTASFGLVTLDANSGVTSSEELYAKADKLLYRAKSAGRNLVIYDTR